MNADLRIDADEADTESPVSHDAPSCAVTVVVGGDERPVFLDQSQWLTERWSAEQIVLSDRHHFDVIEALEAKDSKVMQALLR